ncbi:MAG: zf-HC2 domain-containing protein [Clostridia bacterium]|nr:zf-HC2 domain-containing protein [Clostridia bacterium]
MPEDVMKIPCAVARDLMSLEDGGAYAEQTRNILRRHLEECPECAKMYAETRRAVSGAVVGAAEAEVFRREAGKKKRKNPLRTALKWAALSLAALLLVGAGVFAFIQLYDTQFDVPMDQYTAALYQTGDGAFYLHARTIDGAKSFTGMFVLNYARVSETGVLSIRCLKSLLEPYRGGRPFKIEQYMEPRLVMREGKLYAWTYEDYGSGTVRLLGEVTEIRKDYRHGDGCETVWRAGDEIPVSSEYAPRNGLTEEQREALMAEIG